MLRHQIIIAIRYLLRHKAYSALNILGLAVGLSVSVMISNWVRYEYSFDRHHKKADRIYRIIHEVPGKDGSSSFRSSTGGRLAPTLK